MGRLFIIIKFNAMNDISVIRGKSGEILLLLDELLLEGNTKVKNQVERSINQTLNAIDECCDISFGYGMTGVMYLLALTKQYSYISYDLSQIFEYLDRSTVRQLSEFNGNYDLLHGLVGLGVSYLARSKCDDTAKVIIEQILLSIEQCYISINKYDFIPYRIESHTLFTDNLWVNTGLLHGMTSVVAFYLICIKEGLVTPKLINRVNEYMDILEKIQQYNKFSVFPNAFIINEDNDFICDNSSSGFFYCHGDLGIANTILMAADILHNNEYYNLAERTITNFYDRMHSVDLNYYNPFFCHGMAGVYYFLMRFTKYYPYSRNIEIAREMQVRLTHTNAQKVPLGILNGRTGVEMALKSERRSSFIERVLLLD